MYFECDLILVETVKNYNWTEGIDLLQFFVVFHCLVSNSTFHPVKIILILKNTSKRMTKTILRTIIVITCKIITYPHFNHSVF